MTNKQVRCAVYTRKSSEEGLEQSFNSLEAQRDACRAYVLSQKHEGWTVLDTQYDDGGFSGGNIERPALKQLLADIVARKIDTVVVYKVDRLTRSLGDFSKIIEVFDSHGVSFVSVTQQFNTTTSMGRLTLNVLLSFAQFEREVTGERIRDKVAASKKKGMWMGGVVSQGYDCVDHQLIVNESEAEIVRTIFRKYLNLGSVKKLKDYLDQKQVRSKLRTSVGGRTSGGAVYSRGALYHLLKNRIYIGEIVHRKQCYTGKHQAIVPRKLWDQVETRLNENNQAHRTSKSHTTPSLLSGVLFDTKGIRFTPTHTFKAGRRYRYYTSQTVLRHSAPKPIISRYPAQDLEELVIHQIYLLLTSPETFLETSWSSDQKEVITERALDFAKNWRELETSKQYETAKNVVQRVVVGRSSVRVEVDKRKLAERLLGHKLESETVAEGHELDTMRLTAEFKPYRRGSSLRFESPEGVNPEGKPIPSLVKALARGRDWCERVVAGEVGSVGQLAKQTGLHSTYIKRILGCAMLSPEITEIVLSGRHRPDLMLHELLRNVPMDWRDQTHAIALEWKSLPVSP
jgi:site-specific DNA recombinase